MTISLHDLKKVSHLARLRLNQEEEQAFFDKLTSILQMIEAIQQVDTTGVTPMAHPLAGAKQALRDDIVTEPDIRDQVQALSQHTQAGLYLVPQVIEG